MNKLKSNSNVTKYSFDKKGNVRSVSYTSSSSKSYGFNMRVGLKSVFAYIFIVLLICLVIRLSLSSEPLTLYSLLTFLQNFNNSNDITNLFNNISNGLQSITIPNLPSIDVFGVTIGLRWISDIWNFFVNLESVVVWLAGNLVYVVSFIIQLFKFVFVI